MDIQKTLSKNFFDIEKNAKEYIEMCEGMDGRFLIDILKTLLAPKSKVLEIGIGPGVDLNMLGETFEVIGSDYSQVFLDIYKQKHPTSDLLLLNAVTLETHRKFDCIYSNKVLHHLTRDDLVKSFKKQKDLLNQDGILFHTFWHGDKEEMFQDLRFIHYTINQLKKIVQKDYELIKIDTYKEMNKNDSIYLILRNI